MNSTLVITNEIPVAYIGLLMGFVLIFAAALLKSPLVWLAAFVCFIGIYFEPEIFDTYYQVAAGVMMVFCLIMATINYQQKRRGQG